MSDIRNNWTREEITALFEKPLLDLVFEAASLHRKYQNYQEVQLATLLSVKTGGCPEDCGYCPQAARYNTGVEATKLMKVDEVLKSAQVAKENGSTRFCMGAAWREVRDGKDFDDVIEMVKGVNDMGLESCVTLGLLNEDQAKRLADAGLVAYNHNVDTSPEFYGEIIHTRTYENRLKTIENVRKAGITVCSGGIIGMGERMEDRVGLIHTLSNLSPHPESVPINALVSVEGTPLENTQPINPFEFVRMIAVARITMPKSKVRLSAGRLSLSDEAQAFCFMAGANSIFTGEKLLTTGNPGFDHDHDLLNMLGLKSLAPHSTEVSITEEIVPGEA